MDFIFSFYNNFGKINIRHRDFRFNFQFSAPRGMRFNLRSQRFIERYSIPIRNETMGVERNIYIYVLSMEISPIPIFVILIERSDSCLTMDGLLMLRTSSNMTRMKNAFTTSFKLRRFCSGGSFASRFRVFPTTSSFPALHASLATFNLVQRRRIFLLWLVVPTSCRVLLYFRFRFFLLFFLMNSSGIKLDLFFLNFDLGIDGNCIIFV